MQRRMHKRCIPNKSNMKLAFTVCLTSNSCAIGMSKSPKLAKGGIEKSSSEEAASLVDLGNAVGRGRDVRPDQADTGPAARGPRICILQLVVTYTVIARAKLTAISTWTCDACDQSPVVGFR